MWSSPAPSEHPTTKVSPDEGDGTDDIPIINEEEIKGQIIDTYMDLKTEDAENLKRAISRLEDFESTTNDDHEELGLDAFARKRVLMYCRWLNHVISENPDFTIEMNPEQSYLSLSPVALQGWGRKFIATKSVAALNEPFADLGKTNISGLMSTRSTSSEIADSEFVIKFKGLSSAPTFDRKIENFNTFNRKLKAWLGIYHLMPLIGNDRAIIEADFPMRNKWFYNALILLCPGTNNAAIVAIEKVKGIDGNPLTDGNVAYQSLMTQYGGTDAQELIVERARGKILRARLEPTGDIGTHIAVLQQAFDVLERYGEGYTERHKVTTLRDSLVGDIWSLVKNELLYRANRFHQANAILRRAEPSINDIVQKRSSRNDQKGKANHASQPNTGSRNGGKNGGQTIQKNDKPQVTCWYCQKEGHVKKDCFKCKKDMEEKKGNANSAAVADSNKEQEEKGNLVKVTPTESLSFFNQNQRGQAKMALACQSTRLVFVNTSVLKVFTDSYCDTTFLGDGWLVLDKSIHRTITMSGFNGSTEGTEKLPVVTAVTKVTLSNGKTALIKVHEVAYRGKGNSLLSNAQCGANGIEVDDKVHFRELIIRLDKDAHIPLNVCNSTSSFNISVPSTQDLEDYEPYTLTADTPWNPSDVDFGSGKYGEAPPRIACAGFATNCETRDPMF